MKRTVLAELLAWKDRREARKPLVLKGARQVGKTWALLEFGQKWYVDKGSKCHYIDLREFGHLHSIFQETSDPEEIIKLLEFRLKISIDIYRDLLILDEIQECPAAIISLKYFEQNLKDMDLIVAGSHLGLMTNEESFPVGKVNFLYMFPLTFREFVMAVDVEAFGYLHQFDYSRPFSSVVHERLLELWDMYSFTGGLPEVVSVFISELPSGIGRAIKAVKKTQTDLVEGYRADFAKYSGVTNANHINHVFNSIPAQLSRAHDESVNKYIFKAVIPKRKGLDAIRGPLSWLIASRLCIKNSICKKALHPLSSYCDENKFKVFLFDVGILNCILRVPGEVIIDHQAGPYKGFLLENLVAQELFAKTNSDLASWREGIAELEFLLADNASIIPVEVKSAQRSRKSKSLDSFIARYSPGKAIRLSRQNYSENSRRKITTLPVYCVHAL